MAMQGELKFGDEDPVAAQIREIIGAGPYDRITVTGPQFERTDGKEITFIPKGKDQFDALKEKAPDSILIDIGMGKWTEKDGIIHWLFPAEWYESIPEGYEIVVIDDTTERFKPGETDNDRRFGMLAYGWKRKKREE